MFHDDAVLEFPGETVARERVTSWRAGMPRSGELPSAPDTPAARWNHAIELGIEGSLWAWMDLNHRPLPYQGSALTELSYRPSWAAVALGAG
jgi:hypothetical protein